MTESKKIHEAEDYIARKLLKHGASRIDALDWEQGPHDPAAGIHRLIVSRGGEKSIFTFTEYELLENYGSKEWEKQLRGHVGEILMEL
jgi:hypothetical protein